MSVEIGLGVGLAVAVLAFFLEYLDASLGMGYGTTLTPLLLIVGFDPIRVVPAVLISQIAAGVVASFFHHRMENVNFGWGQQDLKVMSTLTLFGLVGAFLAVFVALQLPPVLIEVYIGTLVLAIGIFVFATVNRHFEFSWPKIVGLSFVAAFNKGMSGGGYGPLVTGGQILSGVEGKRAIGITSLAEGLVSTVAVLSYLLLTAKLDLSLAPYLVVGASLSTPLSALTVRKVGTRILRFSIGALTIILGATTVIKILL
ncbi:MAG: sulfite exporter TauE/SafE family protein [Terriglobia bacterium]